MDIYEKFRVQYKTLNQTNRLELLNLLEPQLKRFTDNPIKVQLPQKKFSHKLVKLVLNDLGFKSTTKKPESVFTVTKK